MATVISVPSGLCFLENLPKFELSDVSGNVEVRLIYNGTAILTEEYEAFGGNLKVDFSEIIRERLTVLEPNLHTNKTVQTKSVGEFVISALGVNHRFTVLKGGVQDLDVSVNAYCKENFLTHQTQIKGVRPLQPEFLTYYAQQACKIVLVGYYTNKEPERVDYLTLSAGECASINVSYFQIQSLFLEAPTVYDVFVEDATSSTRFSIVQRYTLIADYFKVYSLFLFENSLGGVDTLHCTGEREESPSADFKTATREQNESEYDVAYDLKIEQHTGFINSYDKSLFRDFINSTNRWEFIDNTMKPIRLEKITDKVSSEDDFRSGKFVFSYTEHSKLQKSVKSLNELPMPKGLVSNEELFFLISETGAHTHYNLTLLDALSFSEDYLLVNSDKIKAGYADSARDALLWESKKFADYLDQPVRSTDEVVHKSISSKEFQGGFAGKGYKIDKDNTATFDNLVVRKQMQVYELIINKIRASNGAIWVSDSMKYERDYGTDANTFRIGIDDKDFERAITFRTNDIILSQRWTGAGIRRTVLIVNKVSNDANYIECLKSNLSGATPELGDEFVRIGNLTNADRQGALYLTSSDENAPYLDVLDGVTSEDFSNKIKVRLGRLDGIIDDDFGTLSGYGVYTQKGYFKGKVHVTGGNAETKNGAQIKATQAKAEALHAIAISVQQSKVAWENYANLQANNASSDALRLAKQYAQAEDARKEALVKAYADGKITESEQRAINVAEAKANLAETNAKAHADNVITAEEQKRIADAEAKLLEAKAHAKELDDAIKVGGVNLLNGSDTYINTHIYNLGTWDFEVEPKEGDVLTLTLWGELGADRSRFAIYNSGGGVFLGSLVEVEDGVFRKTFAWKSRINETQGITIFQMYSTGVSVSTIRRVKLEEGNKGSGWSPSLSDQRAELFTTITESEARSKLAWENYANLQANLAEANAKASADGKITAEEQARINSVANALATAKTYAETQDALLKAQQKAYADGIVTDLEARQLGVMQRKVDLAEANAKAHADGKVTEAEQRAINTARANLDNAYADLKAYTDTAKSAAINSSLEAIAISEQQSKVAWENYATAKANNASNEALVSAKAYAEAEDARLDALTKAWMDGRLDEKEVAILQVAEAKANLAKEDAVAHADNVVSAEEQKRIADAESKLIEAKAYAQEKVDAIKVGGVNLLNGSDTYINTHIYNLGTWKFEEEPKEGDVLTLTLWGELGADRSRFAIYNSGGGVFLGNLEKLKEGVYRKTFAWKSRINETQGITIFQMYSTGVSVSTIRRVKLEEGNKGTGWSPSEADRKAETSAKVAEAKSVLQAQIDASRTALVNQISALENKNDFLKATTINGATVFTGVAAVGNENGSNAGITGIDAGDEAVRLFAGSDFAGRNSAPFRVLDNGKVIMQNGEVVGRIVATSGAVGGFAIEGSYLHSGNYAYGGLGLLQSGVIFRADNNNIFAGIGSNVLPVSSGITGLLRLSREFDDMLGTYGAYIKVRNSNSWGKPHTKAIHADGDTHFIGGHSFYDDNYIGIAGSNTIENYIEQTHQFLFTDVSSSYNTVRLPNKAKIDSITNGAGVSFLLQITMAVGCGSKRIKLQGVSNGVLRDNNGGAWNGGYGAKDLAKGDVLLLRYHEGSYYLINYRN